MARTAGGYAGVLNTEYVDWSGKSAAVWRTAHCRAAESRGRCIAYELDQCSPQSSAPWSERQTATIQVIKMSLTATFTSFDFDHDEDLKNLLLGQAKNPDSPFWIADYS